MTIDEQKVSYLQELLTPEGVGALKRSLTAQLAAPSLAGYVQPTSSIGDHYVRRFPWVNPWEETYSPVYPAPYYGPTRFYTTVNTTTTIVDPETKQALEDLKMLVEDLQAQIAKGSVDVKERAALELLLASAPEDFPRIAAAVKVLLGRPE